jgi:exopolyphosphatase / guanosine-5'-triphosphate,3'-diphosphate pyrophosphatase
MSEVVGASVDVGSNSVHLLVARVDDHQLTPLADESAFLGLGARVSDDGLLGATARAELAGAVAGYVATARGLGASIVTVVGTEPIRRAADGPAIVDDVGRAAGVPLHVLTHEEEAYLTVIGVTEGRLLAHEALVVDVGGGSSEFCLVGPDRRPRALGLRLGAGRLTQRFVVGDPPTAAEIEAMRAEARRVLAGAPDGAPRGIVAVGGTVSNLLKVVRFGATEGTLTRSENERALALLGAEPSELSAQRHGVRPVRARLLPAGAVIVEALLDRYAADEVQVSDAGIRDGAILAAAHAGHAWRDGLPVLAHGWRG